MTDPANDAKRLETALRWLESHHRRLGVQKRALEHQISDLNGELDRVAREIEAAADRLRRLKQP